ncbi:diphthamide biosynthesis 2 [Labeo rohita]|uniref:2-(3-amino-3-carboxypropyl)histidine synthase subunit 2 n=1 Tax=Labeo rohita TaxID=84645 RepID=A0A498MJ46_LABRO|nr:diphthamide biosynthesis 2 [Labeo rohita]
MPLSNNKVADDGTSAQPLQEGKAMVDSLIKVVACYRHLASCVGGCTDNSSLRRDLRQTRERAQALALSCRNHLTARLRDKTLPEAERKETELLWVAFSSCLELLHADMCKVFTMAKHFSLANNSTMVQTGIQGGTTEVAARALSLPDLKEAGDGTQTSSMEGQEQSQLEQEIAQVDRTLEDMELKVNVLRWTVEALGPQYADPVSTDSASLALLSIDEEAAQGFCSQLSTSVKTLQYDLKRSDIAKSGNRKLFFDTHAMVQLLEESGFITQQAEVIVNMLVNITNSNMDVMYGDMATKTQQEIMLQKVMSHIAAVKKDMIILEKSEFSALLTENEDVINKRRADAILDLNVEKSRVKELTAEFERKLIGTRNELMEMVALQFPDELLPDAVRVSAEIENETKSKTFILGDTSYGSCCVDEVAAEHVGADCIVHYGTSCLSPCRRLPLLYVFGKRPIDVQQCAAAFKELYPDPQSHVIVLYDVTYSHAIGDLRPLLCDTYPNVVVSHLKTDHSCSAELIQNSSVESDHTDSQDDNIIFKFGRQFSVKAGQSVDNYSMFYIGQEGLTLTNFMMTWNHCSFSSFNPETHTGRVESVKINKALMKRYYAIERAKDASVVGILVGTLGVANYLTIIEQLKDIIHKAGKKSYMFAMGKINVPKLANFLEIDVYVLVACPENSLLDSSEFYRPVVTPFEMDLACNKHREWTGEYVTDFRDLLPGGSSHVGFPEPDQSATEEETTDVSLITGALRTCSTTSSEIINGTSESSSLVLRNQTLTVANTNTAASFLAGRSWQGLEPKLGQTPVVKAVKGRRGIAIAYEEEGVGNKDALQNS